MFAALSNFATRVAAQRPTLPEGKPLQPIPRIGTPITVNVKIEDHRNAHNQA